MILYLSLIISILSTIHGQGGNFPLPPIRTAPNNQLELRSTPRISFPQCLNSGIGSSLFNPSTLQNIFQVKLQGEERKLKQERARNDDLKNNGVMDFDANQLRSDTQNGALTARVATKVSEEIIQQLGCATNAGDSQRIDNFLQKIQMPDSLCAFNPKASCQGLTRYRTVTGVCNNIQRPYEGSSQTAYARLLPAAYDDGISLPRSQSVLGGPLPNCRQISLSLGSKPVFDPSYNNLFVTYGQFLAHDFTLATPVTDTGRTPITSCSCNSHDADYCMVIDTFANDPFMSGQKCMSLPGTAQAFSHQTCTLGVKDQMNGNSHYIDLSVTYGSTRDTARSLRADRDGLLKSATKPWSKYEMPPGQRDATACIDSTPAHRCFAGGDSRLMENVLLSGIQTQWLRLHNTFARELANIRPDWRNNDDILYEETKKILSGLHQRYTYENWLPILIGNDASERFCGDNGLFSRYNPNLPGVIYNEAATAALRLHTLVRDLYTRCKPNGQLIDQVWLNDIAEKAKLAYDEANNGVDSLICGSLSDFGSANDVNYAQTIHHRLFEDTNAQGNLRRHDMVAINVCRGREHGIQGYNAYREVCGLRRAQQFQDFSDTMSAEAVQRLQTIYKHPDDVDLFIGINHDNHVPGGVVGPVSACIIGMQFQRLKYGDRFFYKHEGEFTPAQLDSINNYSYTCFICHSTDIDSVAANPFRPPNGQTNPLIPCNQCPLFDFSPWRLTMRSFQ